MKKTVKYAKTFAAEVQPVETDPWEGFELEPDPREDDPEYRAYCEALDRQCGSSLVMGPHHDPYSTTCDLDMGHTGAHEGWEPICGETRIKWTGGGSCAGDPLPSSIISE